MVNNKTIYVQCKRPDLGTTHAVFSMEKDHLQIAYLRERCGLLYVVQVESLYYNVYGEAKLLHDGQAWNVRELQCWIRYAETVEKQD